jgi:hypothetical protein
MEGFWEPRGEKWSAVVTMPLDYYSEVSDSQESAFSPKPVLNVFINLFPLPSSLGLGLESKSWLSYI